MKASETKLRVLLEGQKQFQVPLFQRPYSWEKEDWETLWEDLLETYLGGGRSHFLGSIVTKALPGTPDGISPFLVIDGQQRLTTLSILLAAIRDHVHDTAPDLAEKLDDLYLRNKYAKKPMHLKVRPTQVDRPSFEQVLDGDAQQADGAIGSAYRFFREQLKKKVHDLEGVPRSVEPGELQQVVMGLLELVSITLGEDDNEYRIFESLNAKGQPLTQADLIRNHFFMRIPTEDQESAFYDIWLPMQERLEDSLADYFRLQLQATGQYVREDDTYQEWKEELAKFDAEALVSELRRLDQESVYYLRLERPENEDDPDIRRALERLNRWRGRTTYPYLLNVYRDLATGKISKNDVIEIAHILESFQIRRFLVEIPTNQLNRLFLRLYHQVPDDLPLVDGTIAVLSEPSRRWPRDEDILNSIATFPLYRNGRPYQRRFVLETIVQDYGHKEPVDLSTLSIEHILPQTLTQEWARALGERSQLVHEKYVHTLGNLTLTGYNPELSNAPFEVKRDRLRGSNLAINRELAKVSEWNEEQIVARSEKLAERCLRIWTGPLPTREEAE